MTEEYLNWEWDEYFLRSGSDFKDFWYSFTNSKMRDILFILGLGFDPRMNAAIEVVIDAQGIGKRDCLLLEFNEGEDSPSKKYSAYVNANFIRLNRLFKNRGTIIKKNISMISKDKRRIGSRSTARLFLDASDFNGYTDIIIDISALPRVLYFPLIKRLLDLYDDQLLDQTKKPNIHAMVVENPALDSTIQAEGIEDKADYIYGFRGDIELEATADVPRIWMPLIGENRADFLMKIHTLVSPEEICPILPFPATSPRRGDNLLMEYRELLLDHLQVEPGNILYVAEHNPFEVYRKIIKTSTKYSKALESIGGCKIIVSATSSKILSIGALLAVYDLGKNGFNVGIAHVETRGYEMQKPLRANALDDKRELFSLWLKGECNEK